MAKPAANCHAASCCAKHGFIEAERKHTPNMTARSDKTPLRPIVSIFLFHLVLFLIAWSNYREDTNLRVISLSDLQLYPGAESIVSLPDAEDPYGSIVIGEEGGNAYQGPVLVGPYISIAPGEYDLHISYEASGADAVCEVYSSSLIQEDNFAGAVLASATLPAGSDSCTIHYTVEKMIRNAEFKFYYNGGELRIHAIENQNSRNFSDAFVVLFLFCMFELAVFVLIRRCRAAGRSFMPVWNFVLLTAVALIATIPILNDFQASAHDLLFHYSRINGITDWLRNLSFDYSTMRISMAEHNGYGYITPIMYPQLFLYIPALLRLAGCSMLLSYKILVFLANCAAAYLAFFSYARIFQSRQIGLLSASLYVLNLYRLASIYTRGALGEFLAMVFLPLLFYGIYEILYGDCRRWQYAFVGFSGIIQSHIITVVIAAVCCCLALVFALRELYHNQKRVLSLLIAASATLFANLWFIVPFLQYMGLDLSANQPSFRLHYTGVYLSQMFASFVSNGSTLLETGSTAGEMPLSVGTIVLIGMILFVSYAFVSRKFSGKLRQKGIYCLAAGVVALFASSVYFPWNPILATSLGERFSIQFLCRLLPIASLFLSPVTAIGMRYTLYAVTGRRNRFCLLTLVCITIFCSFYSIDSCLDQEGISKEFCEVMDTGDGMYLLREAEPSAVSYDGLLHGSDGMEMQVHNYRKEYASLEADLTITAVGTDAFLDLPFFYYPHYRVTDQNGQELPVTLSPEGLLRITPSDALTHIQASFQEPLAWKICSLISFLFLLLWGVYEIRVCRRTN